MQNQYNPNPPPPHDPSPDFTLSCMPLHHLLATKSNLPTTLSHKPHTLLQLPWESTAPSPQCYNNTYLPSLHHIITTNPKTPTEPPNRNSLSSRHIKSFSTIRIDLLAAILVTFATSHWLRSPLKALAVFWADWNTVARKRWPITFTSNAQEKKAEEPGIRILWQPKEGKIIHHHQPQTPDWTPQSQQHELVSRQVILHYTYWLTLLHGGYFRDVPLIEVSVEGGSPIKHCRKKRRLISFTVSAQEK